MHFTTIATVSISILGFASQNVFAVPVDSLDKVDYYDQGSSKVSKRGLGDVVSGVVDGVGGAVENVGGNVADTVSVVGDDVGKLVSDAADQIATILADTASDIGKVLQGIAKNAGGATGSLP